MSALASMGFAASLTLIAPSEKCAPTPSQKTIRWDVSGSVPVANVLIGLSELTCELFVVPSWLASRTVKLDGGNTPRTVTATRRWLLSALESQGVHVRPDRTMRVSGGEHAGSNEPASVPPVPPPPNAVTDAVDLDHGIDCQGRRCRIDRALLDRVLANPTVLATSARFVPSIHDGVPNGFKLYAIRPDSFFSRLGLQNGDTVNGVNGLEMTTPDAALEVYTKLRTADHLSVTVERRGEILTFDYEIRG